MNNKSTKKKKIKRWLIGLAVFVVISLVGFLFFIRAANQIPNRNMLYNVRLSLRMYEEEYKSLPYKKDADTKKLWQILFPGTPIMVPEGYHMVNRTPEDWKYLSRFGIGTLAPHNIIGHWPFAWCQSSPFNNKLFVAYSNTAVPPTEMSKEEFDRSKFYAKLFLENRDTVPDFSKTDFFTWGFQKDEKGIIKKGLQNLQKAKKNSVGLTMVHIPAGIFKLGITEKMADHIQKKSGGNRESENACMPPHEVQIDEFYVSFSPVTNQPAWEQFINSGKLPTGQKGQKEGGLSWCDAKAFCDWLTKRERDLGLIPKDKVYRLPTEAEWEWMMLGGGNGPYSWGSVYPKDDQKAIYPYSLINGYGIVAWDTAKECCFDKYAPDFYKRSPLKNPVCLQVSGSSKKVERVIRGGNWGTRWAKSGLPAYLNNRRGIKDNYRVSNLSFRVVLGKKINE